MWISGTRCRVAAAARRGAGRRVRGLLVSSEVALAVVLVIVMAMLAKSFANVQAVSPGFEPTHVMSAPPHVAGEADSTHATPL